MPAFEAAANGPLQGSWATKPSPWWSCDYVHDPRSAIVDGSLHPGDRRQPASRSTPGNVTTSGLQLPPVPDLACHCGRCGGALGAMARPVFPAPAPSHFDAIISSPIGQYA